MLPAASSARVEPFYRLSCSIPTYKYAETPHAIYLIGRLTSNVHVISNSVLLTDMLRLLTESALYNNNLAAAALYCNSSKADGRRSKFLVRETWPMTETIKNFKFYFFPLSNP